MSKLPSIYGLIDPRDGALRYIGKANTPSARLKGHLREARRRNTPLYAWVRKLAKAGLAPELTILESEVSDWREAERRHIADARVRAAPLLNLADGGDEPYCSPEVRRANAVRLNARLASDPLMKRLRDNKRALAQANRLGYLAERTKIKMREAARLNPAMFGEWASI